jgi:hypothetical protein
MSKAWRKEKLFILPAFQFWSFHLSSLNFLLLFTSFYKFFLLNLGFLDKVSFSSSKHSFSPWKYNYQFLHINALSNEIVLSFYVHFLFLRSFFLIRHLSIYIIFESYNFLVHTTLASIVFLFPHLFDF